MKLAEKARGLCSPNPFVGAVIVSGNKVVGEGWTQAYGNDHAEIQALQKAGTKARGADLYVTLEPCSHQGKTPPCTEAIIRAGIKRVFIGIPDPNPLVRQNTHLSEDSPGIIALREAGIEVEIGFLMDELLEQLEYHYCHILARRPFLIWKAALSLDGKYAAEDGSSQWITSEQSREYVHKLRQGVDVVLTSISTVIADDPRLNVRLPKPKRQPVRAILDPFLELPPDSQIACSLESQTTYIFHLESRSDQPIRRALEEKGAILFPVKDNQRQIDPKEVMQILHKKDHYSVMLECGSRLATSFLSGRLINKCYLFYGAKFLGGSKAILSELALPDIGSALQLDRTRVQQIGNDVLVVGYPKYH